MAIRTWRGILPVLALIAVHSAAASTYSFATTVGAQSSNGDPLNISGTIVISNGDLQISLSSDDTPGHETSALYGITFQLNQALTISTPIVPDSISTTLITIHSDGTFSTSAPGSATLVANTAWNLAGTTAAGHTNLKFSVAGTGQPNDMLIGPPSGSTYSISGISSVVNHDPYYYQDATFDILVPGLLSSDVLTSLSLLLGTTPDVNSSVTLTNGTITGGSVPEPATGFALASGILLFGAAGRRKRGRN